MKRFFLLSGVLLLLVLALRFPELVQLGATYGLNLWSQILLPTMLPFLLLTGILFRMSTLEPLSRPLAPLVERVLHLPRDYSPILLLGLLSGMPVGASLLAERLKKDERVPLYPLVLSTCLSPGFLVGYLCTHCFGVTDITFVYCAGFYVLHLLFGAFACKMLWPDELRIASEGPANTSRPDTQSGSAQSATTTPDKSLADIIEETVTASLAAIARVGAYVMLFSTLSCFLQAGFEVFLPKLPSAVSAFFCGLLEVTSGCSLLADQGLPLNYRMPLMTGLVSFGGLSGVLQTKSMLAEYRFPIGRYIKMRATIALLMTGATSALMYVCYVL